MSSHTAIGSELDADYLFKALVGEVNATLPNLDLFDETHTVPWDKNSEILKPVEKVGIDEVVSEFHALMGGVGAELQKEYDAGRITGAKYADTFLALTQGALQGAVQFALGKDQAFWMSAKTQADAIAANNANELARLQAMLSRANYALTKLKLATEDSTFGSSEYTRLTMLPAQKVMVDEQMEGQRAQTSDTRSDETTVAGILGSQKALYDQQKQNFIDDTKIKATRVFSDLWTTQYTMNDGGTKVLDAFDPSTTNMDPIFAGMATIATGP
jgi:hypothetical protein